MRFGVVAVLWIASASWFWDRNILAVPTCRIDYGRLIGVAGFTRESELAVYRSRKALGSPREGDCEGPIEFWKFPEGVKVRETFTSEDHIISNHMPPTGEIVLERGGKYFAANASTGEVLGEIICETGPPLLPMVDGAGKRLSYFDGPKLRMYDLKARRELWTADGYERFWCGGPGFEVVTPIIKPVKADRTPYASGVVQVLDASTGQLDHRFDHLGVAYEIRAFPESRYAVVKTEGQTYVCNALTGELLWTFPKGVNLINYSFENNDTELCSPVADKSGNLVVARWKAEDGTVITPVPAQTKFGYRSQAVGARYCVDDTVFPEVKPVTTVMLLASRWMGGRTFNISSRRAYRVWDLERNVLKGMISRNYAGIIPSPDGAGCIVDRGRFIRDLSQLHELNRFEYYSFPPERNWGWLLRFGFGPPVVLWIVLRGWRRWKRGVRTSVSESAPAVAASARAVDWRL